MNTVRLANPGSKTYAVTATDVTGNTVTLRSLGTGIYDLRGLPAGHYLLSVSDHGVVVCQSAVVKLNP
jgi:hypothetical protein